MLQKEFEDRIGRKVTTEEYVEANAMYMMAGELDKDEFCREWLKIGSSKLVQCLFEKAHSLDQNLQEQQLVLKEGQEIISDAADAMLEILDLVIENRRIVAEERIGNAKYEALVKSMISHCRSRKKMDCPQWLKKLEIKQLVSKNAFTKRSMPELAPKSFNQLTKKTEN